MVPLARLERARPYEQQILNLSRLPVPPQGQWTNHGRGLPARIVLAPKCLIVRSHDEQEQNQRSGTFPHRGKTPSQITIIAIVKSANGKMQIGETGFGE